MSIEAKTVMIMMKLIEGTIAVVYASMIGVTKGGMAVEVAGRAEDAIVDGKRGHHRLEGIAPRIGPVHWYCSNMKSVLQRARG